MRGDVRSFFRNFEAVLLSVRSRCAIFLIFSFISLQVSGFMPPQAPSLGGLKFQGSEQPINQRTSYDVLGDKTASFSDYFNIEFNLSLYPATKIGYLIRIKNKENNIR